MNFKQLIFVTLSIVVIFSSCTNSTQWSFDQTYDRTWIGSDFWSVPLEDWQVKDGKVECIGSNNNMRVNQLTHILNGEGNLNLSVQLGINQNHANGAIGIEIGLQDETDDDVRSLCYYGKGTKIKVNSNKTLQIGSEHVDLPEQFNLSSFELKLKANAHDNGFKLQAQVTDLNGIKGQIKYTSKESLKGIISVFNQLNTKKAEPSMWFDNLEIGGSMVEQQAENSFGPILFNMYTLNKRTMKMTVQMPPIGAEDEQKVVLKVLRGENYLAMATAKIDKESRIAKFKLKNWSDDKTRPYRIIYKEKQKNGTTIEHVYEGTIQQNPKKASISMAALTCQHWQAYPYKPLTENLKISNPDILYFSGDQIYEANGGYGIVRDNAEKAILNYLGKWYMFGWAFRDVMKDRPTICIPDDHEVYQGNLWGAGGKKITTEQWKLASDCTSGFVQPLEMIKVVMETNSSHLPDPFDSTPMDNNIPVYYTEFLYGKVSFAIVGDRVFKSGPEEVAWWKGRKDHIKFDLKNPSKLETESLKLLGERQLKFLEQWANNWNGIEMKCVLSQTVFNNSATHHGPEREFLTGDMDAGGWPKTGRDKAVAAIRRAGAIHICGDQHLPSLQQYGIKEQRDASWVYCTPAISVGYERRFLPDLLGKKVINRPEHDLPNTGEYNDAFGNKFYMYAVANPEEETQDANRYTVAQKRASGYGTIEFNKPENTVTFDAVRFLADLKTPSSANHFLGWPKTINMIENIGTNKKYWLPTMVIKGEPNSIVSFYEEPEHTLIYRTKIKGNLFDPMVNEKRKYSIAFTVPGVGIRSMLNDPTVYDQPGQDSINIDLDTSIGFTVKEIKPAQMNPKDFKFK